MLLLAQHTSWHKSCRGRPTRGVRAFAQNHRVQREPMRAGRFARLKTDGTAL